MPAISMMRFPSSEPATGIGIWASTSRTFRISSPEGSLLDAEARHRGTSVYLPRQVIPMLPEVISNGLASLQQGKLRFTKSVLIEFTAEGIPVHTEFANSAIKVNRRFAYEEVMPIIKDPERFRGRVSAKVRQLLENMHTLAMMLRKRRFAAGALELNLPEIKIDFNQEGEVTGAHEACTMRAIKSSRSLCWRRTSRSRWN